MKLVKLGETAAPDKTEWRAGMIATLKSSPNGRIDGTGMYLILETGKDSCTYFALKNSNMHTYNRDADYIFSGYVPLQGTITVSN